MEYKDKNRNIQNEFLLMLEACLKAFDEADKKLEEVNNFIKNIKPENTSKVDMLRSDFSHMFEDLILSDEAIIAIGRKMQEVSDDRRNWHNINVISEKWLANYTKIYYKEQRPFLRNTISQVIKTLDKPYNYRVLSKEEVEEFLSLGSNNDIKDDLNNNEIKKNTRGGYKRMNIATKNNVLNALSKGEKAKDVAKEYGLGLSTVYKLRAEYEDLSRTKK